MRGKLDTLSFPLKLLLSLVAVCPLQIPHSPTCRLGATSSRFWHFMQEQQGICRTRHSRCRAAPGAHCLPSKRKRRKPLSGHFGLPRILSARASSVMQLVSAEKLVESIRNVKIAFCSAAGLPVICFSLSQAAAGYATLCSFNCHVLLIVFLCPQLRHILHL